MNTVDLTKDTFNTTIEDNEIVVVDWWASWCGPCVAFAPVFEAVASRKDDVVFAKVDTEAEIDLAAVAQIQSIPTLMIFRDGVLVFRQSGSLPEAALEDVLQQARDLDMEEVRTAIAAEQLSG